MPEEVENRERGRGDQRARGAPRSEHERDEHLDDPPAPRRPSSTTTASGPRATRRAWSRAPPSGSSRSSCRCSTTSSGRSRRPRQHEEAKLEEGVRLVAPRLSRTCSRREGLEEIATEGKFDPHVHEALLSQPSEAEEGSVIEVLQKGYRLGDRVLRPARVVVAAGEDGAARSDLVRASSASRRTRPPTRSRRRTASSRASTTRTRTRATPRPRSASRRSRRLRRPLRPGEAQAVRRVRLGRTAGGDSIRAQAGRLQLRRRLRRRRSRRPRRPVRRDLRGEARGRQQQRPARRARRRPRGAGQSLLRGLAAGDRDADPGRGRDGLPRLRRLGREARDLAEDLPGVQRPGRHVREPGPLRALAAVSALSRQRHGDRGSVPSLPRLRPRAAHEALLGEDPRRRQGRDADPPQGQGRSRGLRRRPPATSSWSRASAARRSTSAAAPTSWSRCR